MPKDELKEQTKTKLQRKGEAYMSLAKSALTSDPKLQLYYNHYLVENVKEVMDYVTMLCTPDNNGKCPALTEDDLKELKRGYSGIVNAVGSLEKESLKKLGRKSALYLVSHQLTQMAMQDLASLRKFRAELNLSFPEQMLAANTQLIKTNGNKKKVMGACMSSRQAMSAVVQNGDQKVVMRGLFTEQTQSENPKELFEGFFAEYFRQNHLDNTSEEAKALAELRKVRDSKHETPSDVLHNMAFKAKGNKNDIAYSDSLGENRKFMNWYNRYCVKVVNGHKQVNPPVFQMMRLYQRKLDGRVEAAKLNVKAGIPIGGRLDLRNSAMSAVAELLKMENVIAKSVPMAIQQNGKIIQGNFMSFANGVDSKNMGAENEFGKMDMASLNGNIKLMKQAANLQILDFICGNIDRHLGNIFYQFDEQHRMIGIQGIDNDTSFGIIAEECLSGEKEIQKFRSIYDLNFVPVETANVLRSINSEMLRAALSRYGLQKKEIDAACDRYDLLIERLDYYCEKTSPEGFKRLLGNKKLSDLKDSGPQKVYALDDEQIRRIEPGINLSKSNLFRVIKSYAIEENMVANGKVNLTGMEKEQADKWRDKIERYNQMVANHKDEIDLPETELIAREKREIDLPKFADKISQALGTLDEKNHGMFRSSQEYRNIRHYARIAAEAIRNAQDLNPVYTMIENLDALCTVYLDTKKADGSLKKNERSAERVMAVQELQDLLKNMTEKMPEKDHDCYCRLSAIERAGAFRTNTDTAAIAASIEQMENTLHTGGKLTSEQLNLNGIFEGVTRTAWQHMTDHYHNEIVRMTNELKNTKGLPPSVIDRAAALVNAGNAMEPSSEKMNQITTELKKFRTAAENYQNTLLKRTMKINGRDEVILRNDQVKGLSVLNQLIGLSEKAEQHSVKPADTKTRLASMILQKKSSQTNDPGTLQYLTNYDSFRNEVQDLTAQSEGDLRRQCKELRINVTAENLLVQAPARI